MKKFLSILLILLFGFVLIACGKEDNGNGNGNGNGDGGNGDGGNGGTGERPTEIVIMHGAVNEIDPRRDDFSGREKAERIRLHDEVEKDLNVKIVYKPYPSDAAWGPDRQNAIINWHISGQARADIYWITTIWLGEIANANAIVPIDKWLNSYGKNIDDSALNLSTYRDEVWGFAPEPFNGANGLFINTALLAELGIPDPVELWNNGEWTWTRFTQWAMDANSRMDEHQRVLGGVPSTYAENLIPLNGGSIVNNESTVVQFNSNPAIQVYNLLEDWHTRGLFESGGSYDTGSELWAAGDVLLHPGTLWLVRATNRWGTFDFVQNGDIGVIPFPQPDNAQGKANKDEYIQPVGAEAIYALAANPDDKAKEELAFEVWNRLQLWEDDAQREINYEVSLGRIFDDQKHIELFMEIYQNVYFDIHEQIGIASFGADAWQVNVNTGVVNKSTRTEMERILPIYTAAYQSYLSND